MIKEVIINVAILLALAACVGGFRGKKCHGGAHERPAHEDARGGSTTRR